MAIRRARQHVVDQMRRSVRHPARCTRRAQAAAFAAKRDDDLLMARRTAYPREAVGKNTAAQVLGELALDVTRQAATVGIPEFGEQGLGMA